MSSDSEQEEAPLRIFKGLVFFLHGPNPGLTKNGVTKLIKQGGGKVVGDIGDVRVSHVVLSGNYWAKRKTANADLTLKRIQEANEGNRTEKDEDYNRVWLMPLEWVQKCLEEKKLIKERKHDFERTEDKVKTQLAKEAQAQQKEERRRNKGKSKFGRGERVKLANQQRADSVRKEQEQLEKELEAEFGSGGPVEEAFSGVTSSSPVAAAMPGFFPDPFAVRPQKKASSSQPTLSFSIGDKSKDADPPAKAKPKAKARKSLSSDSRKSTGRPPFPLLSSLSVSLTPFVSHVASSSGSYKATPSLAFKDSTPSTAAASASTGSSSPAPLAQATKTLLQIKPSTQSKSSGGMFGAKAATRPPPKPAAGLVAAGRSASSDKGKAKEKGRKRAAVYTSSSDSDAPLAKKLKPARRSTSSSDGVKGKGKAKERIIPGPLESDSDVPLAMKLKTTQAKAKAPLPPVGYSSDSSVVFEDAAGSSGSSAKTAVKGKGRAVSPADEDSSDFTPEPAYAGRRKRVIESSEEEDDE